MTSLVCLLSYGLVCAPAEPAADAPTTPTASPATQAEAPAQPVAQVGTPTPPATPAPAEPEPALGAASQVLARVQSFYDAAADVQGSFEQTYIHPVYGTKTVSKGTLRVKKPGMMVWDYTDADKPDVWINGNKLWAVESANKQLFERSLGSSDFAGVDKFLFGGRQLLEDFRVKLAGDQLEKRYGMPGHTSIRLQPKRKNPHYKELMLVVDDETGRVGAFIVRNGDESTNHFVLSGQKINQGLSKAQMTFRKPDGYAVIRE